MRHATMRRFITAFLHHRAEPSQNSQIVLTRRRICFDCAASLTCVIDAKATVSNEDFPRAGEFVDPREFLEGFETRHPDVHPKSLLPLP
jgi:hypothetical protein